MEWFSKEITRVKKPKTEIFTKQRPSQGKGKEQRSWTQTTSATEVGKNLVKGNPNLNAVTIRGKHTREPVKRGKGGYENEAKLG